MNVDGILNINKPAGRTSFDIVTLVRKLSGERKVGHAGTLDPDATGVLPICLGQATKVIQFLMNSNKSYRAEIELGVSTDTYDSSGRVTLRTDTSFLTKEKVEEALLTFHGTIKQTPPMYSAVRYKGKHLYELARAGIELEREPRKAEIFRLEILDWQPPLVTIEVECSKGTYIRSLAHDLGQLLGCGSHLKSLVRLRSGAFDLKDAVALSQLEDSFRHGLWQELLYPIDAVFADLMAVIVDEGDERAIRNGRPLSLGGRGSANGGRCRAYSIDGRFLAILHFKPEKGLWQPEKVFSQAAKLDIQARNRL